MEPDQWKLIVDKTVDLITNHLSPLAQRNGRVVEFKQPSDLENLIDLAMTNNGGMSVENLLKLLTEVVQYSVKTGHPFFLNQLYHGTDEFGLIASFILEALNTNLHTFDVAPVFTLIEREVITTLGNLCGFDNSDGIFCPGGSIAGMFGISIARYHYDSLIKETGLYQKPILCIFASEQSHYSAVKGAIFMGMGSKSIILVNCNDDGTMNEIDLEDKIKQTTANNELQPFLIWCTAGTTVLGSFDPIDKIHTLAKKYNLWLHVDVSACLGGSALVSRKHKHLLKGIEKADSVVWNWHKMLGSPLQTSAFLTPHKGLLMRAHGLQPDYLFQSDKHYDPVYDLGDASIQCGRKADALKVWVMWKARGLDGLELLIDQAFENAQLLTQKMKQSEFFKLVIPETQGTNVCFWMIPRRLHGAPLNEFFWTELQKLAPKLKLKMVEQGSVMINYQEIKSKKLVNFFRITISAQPPLYERDLDDLVEKLIDLCKDM